MLEFKSLESTVTNSGMGGKTGNSVLLPLVCQAWNSSGAPFPRATKETSCQLETNISCFLDSSLNKFNEVNSPNFRNLGEHCVFRVSTEQTARIWAD